VVAIEACGKSLERKIIHQGIGNPVDEKPIHFGIPKSEILTK
jgi:hypothetical protein